MDAEAQLSRENCEGCATSCKLSDPSCPFGRAAAAERRAEIGAAPGEDSRPASAPLVD